MPAWYNDKIKKIRKWKGCSIPGTSGTIAWHHDKIEKYEKKDKKDKHDTRKRKIEGSLK